MCIEAREEFAQWAKGYSGDAMGNPDGSLWFCGIEPGGGEPPPSIFPDVTQPGSLEGNDHNWFFARKWQFHYRLAKLYSAVLGYEAKHYRRVFHEAVAFQSGSDAFRLNLYPFDFHDQSSPWTLQHYESTGLPTKESYAAWCQINRFPVLLQWATTHRPKAVICCGLGCLSEYLIAFSGWNDAFRSMRNSLLQDAIDDQELKILWEAIVGGHTLLFVIPFLGQGGLLADSAIETVGAEIRRICVWIASVWHGVAIRIMKCEPKDSFHGYLQLGLTVGDAVGTTLEFRRRCSFKTLPDMTGGGSLDLEPDQRADDGRLAVCMAASLLDPVSSGYAGAAVRRFNPRCQVERYARWCRTGHLMHKRT